MKTYKELEREFVEAVRHELKAGLGLCTDKQQQMFKRICANSQLSIGDVVDKIPKDRLGWAMRLVQRTLDKI